MARQLDGAQRATSIHAEVVAHQVQTLQAWKAAGLDYGSCTHIFNAARIQLQVSEVAEVRRGGK